MGYMKTSLPSSQFFSKYESVIKNSAIKERVKDQL